MCPTDGVRYEQSTVPILIYWELLCAVLPVYNSRNMNSTVSSERLSGGRRTGIKHSGENVGKGSAPEEEGEGEGKGHTHPGRILFSERSLRTNSSNARPT